MNRTRRLTATILTTVTLALAYLATAARAATAGAMPAPPPETYSNQPPAPQTTIVNHTSTPVWPYLVAALAAAVLTLAAVWTITRLRQSHTTSGEPASAL